MEVLQRTPDEELLHYLLTYIQAFDQKTSPVRLLILLIVAGAGSCSGGTAAHTRRGAAILPAAAGAGPALPGRYPLPPL